MAMAFEELDAETRSWMLRCFESEEASGSPYRSKSLSSSGLAAFPDLMRDAINDPNGNETTFAVALNAPDLWSPMEEYVRSGVRRERTVNVVQISHRLALTEFNTWYVAGFANRLVDDGETQCEVHRASIPKFEHGACSAHEGMVYLLVDIIAGHRAGYWPEPGRSEILSIPAGPGCHHTIRRIA